VLRRFAELERGEAQRRAVTAWIDHLARMLERPYDRDARPRWVA
jgi:hypothetical protein